jgi:hypothetical protein
LWIHHKQIHNRKARSHPLSHSIASLSWTTDCHAFSRTKGHGLRLFDPNRIRSRQAAAGKYGIRLPHFYAAIRERSSAKGLAIKSQLATRDIARHGNRA